MRPSGVRDGALTLTCNAQSVCVPSFANNRSYMLVGVIPVHVMPIIIKTMAESPALIGHMSFPAGASRFIVVVGLCAWPER
jgi:hypothetical protein